jgi:hypothetical protein
MPNGKVIDILRKFEMIFTLSVFVARNIGLSGLIFEEKSDQTVPCTHALPLSFTRFA